MEFGSAAFWLALLQIIWVNILLSGDNAVVIALAARTLPPRQQRQAVAIGSGAAIVLRVLLTVVAAQLLQLPWLKIVGAVLLVYIGVGLLLPEDDSDESLGSAHSGMMSAVRTILIADLVMSLDNVIAVAAAAKGNMILLVVGLALSIPLVIFGSTLLLRVIEKLPLLVWFGAALLGFIAGGILIEDPVLVGWAHDLEVQHAVPAVALGYGAGVVGALLVVLLGRIVLLRKPRLASN